MDEKNLNKLCFCGEPITDDEFMCDFCKKEFDSLVNTLNKKDINDDTCKK